MDVCRHNKDKSVFTLYGMSIDTIQNNTNKFLHVLLKS